MIKSYKFKIRRPSKRIVQTFEQWLEICRELYNAGLQERRDAWKISRKNISLFDQYKQLTEVREIRADLKSVYMQVLRSPLKRVDIAFKHFFKCIKNGKKNGYPRFKSTSRFNSFTYTQLGFHLEKNKLTLAKIGTVQIRLSQNIKGKIKDCTIKREASGWFVIFRVETISEILPKTKKDVGIDVGIEHFVTLSNGIQIENPRFFEKSAKKLRKVQRKISRCKRKSNRRNKEIQRFRKIHEKIKNQRKDFHQKLSTKLIKEFDLIVVENLNINGLLKGNLSKQIKDVSWGNFLQMLSYKAENAGRKLLKVNPSGTSQFCICGAKVSKKLSQRWHDCANCGYSEHRDVVSAKLILRLGHNLQAKTKTTRL